MKNSRNEKLSEHLLNVDEEILTNAYEIDDAEKLRQYIKTKNAKAKKPFYMTPMFRRVATIAACFVLIVGVVFTAPALFSPGKDRAPENDNHYSEIVPPWLKGEEDYLTINSLAQLNYYAAIRMITEETKTPSLNMTGNKTAGVNYGIVLLSAGSGLDKNEEPPIPETTGPNVSQEPAVTPNNPTSPDYNEDIYYYSLDPNEPFYINRVSMFQIELTDENGFLASKLGIGIVDVVITEECIWGESMITFRNGENFFSCLSNGGGYNRQTGERQWDFSTHKYVEGFYIVKNLAQENYGFYIKMDTQGQAITFDCRETENGGDRVDQNVKVVSTTVFSEEGRSFTVAELEDYFNTGKLAEGTEDPSQTEKPPVITPPVETADFYTNGLYIFELKSDDTFTYYCIDENSAVYRKGTYSMGCDAVEFRFMYEGEVVETVSCDFTGPISFMYNGSEYAKEPSGGEQ